MIRSAVIIPAYRTRPDEHEAASLLRCLTVLKEHDVFLVCPAELDCSDYYRVAGQELPTRRYEARFFQGIEGYNEMLMSHWFYADFADYDYMLIYQLDAWVFTDQLDAWCRKGYDYVGAPWFYRNKSHEQGERLWLVGNGGLSLRKISTFMDVTAREHIAFSWTHVFSSDFHKFSDRLKYLRLRRKLNNGSFKQLAADFFKPWEDLVFCWGLRGTDAQLNVPSVEEAAQFALETSPSYVFREVNHGRLPFGCHAWLKNEYETFWKQYIPANEA